MTDYQVYEIKNFSKKNETDEKDFMAKAANAANARMPVRGTKNILTIPLAMRLTEFFQNKIENWENLFYLPDRVNWTEEKYKKALGTLIRGFLTRCSIGMF